MSPKFILMFFIVLVLGFSCTKIDTELTEEEIIQGLKDALKVGTDTSVTTVSKINGYFGDMAIKIFLPEEASQIINMKDKVPGLSLLIDSMVLSLNRAAEDAAVEAKPIFVNAITSMSIIDAVNILHGSDTAATYYLKQSTYTSLKNLFQPKITTSLDKPIIGVSANSLWNNITGLWNNYANSIPGQWLGAQPVNITLSEYTTNKALYGLFLKIGNEEKDIRHNPAARIDDILKKVFG
jgi:hypothetical protein